MQLILGDCLEEMQKIPDKSIDCIICDLPYGSTHNNWDVIIPFASLWKQYDRIIKNNGAVILFGQGIFSAQLICSNIKNYRYTLIWNKKLATGFLNAKRMPLRIHEDILVFYKSLPTYNPQMWEGKQPSHRSRSKTNNKKELAQNNSNYGDFYVHDFNEEIYKSNLKCPVSIIEIPKIHPSLAVHPTQKPVALLEYLVKTYTNENEVVLDNCMGSGTTGVACVNLNRNFIGMEAEEEYFKIAKERIHKAQTEPK